ncbi:diguanylate cyclase [Sulfurimonas sp. SAG-AH-194-C21]|nr:diguanylate cyclase [Sulfurimonas sp. SAG-AH-194-C21]MDF1883264.1 diguanylate cyclase [Sulfurimonas sp. SAG-AH-194-C21]
MLKNIRLVSVFLLFSIVFIAITYLYFELAKEKQVTLNKYTLSKAVIDIKNDFSSMILQKQKSTLAMAISLANNKAIVDDIVNANIDDSYYKNLSLELEKSTLYKNIWIQILDVNGVSLYRSWTTKKGCCLLELRPELTHVIQKKENLSTISVGKYDLSIKSIAPVFQGVKIVGMIEIISHFNSISKLMNNDGVSSVVVVNKEYTKQLSFPLTKTFLDGHYIANLDASKKDMDYLSTHTLQNYLKETYALENKYLIVSYPIKDFYSKTIAYSVMFKKENFISSIAEEFLLYRWMSVFVIVLLSLTILFTVWLFMKIRTQKKYYKDILDSVTNIVLVFKDAKIIEVNEVFFEYFNKYDTLKDFKLENSCICDYFIEEKGCLQVWMDDTSWLEYILSSKNMMNEVKLKISNEIYIFRIEASPLKHQGSQKLVILSDITNENKLLTLSLTDELTQIGNRRYFNQKLESEISRSKRHKTEFSLVVFDIDFFKKVNDTYGHDTGDDVLRVYSEFISEQLRVEDVLCRIGGEEFAIILADTNEASAEILAEKLRLNIQNYKKVVPITMSFGLAEYKLNESGEEFYKRVDTALYKAKNGGRNKVVVG